MTRLFASQVIAAPEHPFNNITVSHLRPEQTASQSFHGYFQAQVTHDGSHQSFFPQGVDLQ